MNLSQIINRGHINSHAISGLVADSLAGLVLVKHPPDEEEIAYQKSKVHELLSHIVKVASFLKSLRDVSYVQAVKDEHENQDRVDGTVLFVG